VIALALTVVGVSAVIKGYVFSLRQAEISSLNLAAQAQVLERFEQVRAAKWDMISDPPVDNVQSSYFPPLVQVLDVPSLKTIRYGTNFTTITTVWANPPLKAVRVDCVWSWLNGKLYTNSILTYRGPDQ
jgi:hypothetical protein